MNPAPVLDNFSQLAALGYAERLIPVIPPGAPLSPDSYMSALLARGKDSRGKAPGVRGGDGLWRGLHGWLEHHTKPDDLTRWATTGANAGIRSGGGLAAIDADATDPALAAIIAKEINALVPGAPQRVGAPPKTLFLIRTDPDCPYLRLTFGNGQRVEVLTGGRQFVALGRHPSGRGYEWTVPLRRYDELPAVTADQLRALLERLRSTLPGCDEIHESGAAGAAVADQTQIACTPEAAAVLLAAIPNDGERFATRESYLSVGYALRAAVGDMFGLGLFQEWCGRWSGGDNDPEVVAADWRRMKGPYRRGAQWLAELAAECTGSSTPSAALWFEDPERGASQRTEDSLFSPEKPDEPAAPLRFAPSVLVLSEAAAVPPRRFLYGSHFARRYLSTTVAPSKVGKTALLTSEALAMVSGRPLMGVQPRAPRRVWLWNGEDPLDEMRRRVVACARLHAVDDAAIGGRLMVDSGRDVPIVLAAQGRSGTSIARPVSDALVAALRERRVDVLVVDPFISSHAVEENDNAAIGMVAREWARIAELADCAVELVHHTRKLNGEEATVESSRGASALIAATRSTRALARMTADEAAAVGFGRDDDRRRFFRVADAATNLALRADLDEAWLELVSVRLGNGDDEDPGGDDVGAVRLADIRADVLSLACGSSSQQERREEALRLIGEGHWRLDARAGDAWVGCAVARAYRIDRTSEEGKARVKTILGAWLQDGTLNEESGFDEHRHQKQFVKVLSVGGCF